jgi:choline dehydrogenase
MPATVDYVIVGAGTAGCILAARLSEDPRITVLLLEAGGPDSNPAIWSTDVNRLSSLWAPHAAENWGYRTVDERGLEGRAVDLPRGKVLGGSSAINAMIYIRGNRRNFDGWASLGNRGWSYDEVLPYFKKSEAYHGPASFFHGEEGPVSVIDYEDPAPVSRAFVEAAAELGAKERYNDFNGATQEAGAGFYQSTRTPDGVRVSAASAFLSPNRRRENLHVVANVRATRLVLDKARVVGVEYAGQQAIETVRVNREVVLCCGAFETPKLLMLSGLGPATELARNGIRVVQDLPGVGKNLHDHLMLGVVFASRIPLPPPRLLAEAGLFTWSDRSPKLAAPDLQYFFGPLKLVTAERMTTDPGFTFAPILAQPRSRGTVTVVSNDPKALARVEMNYLGMDDDVAVLEYGIRYARELAHTRAFDGLRGRELAPGADVTSKAQLTAFIRRAATTVWHPCGTCRMGWDPDAVVDDQLRVHGITGLRVADASIMPHLVNGNPNAAIMMIAEQAADLIVRRQPDRAPADTWPQPQETAFTPSIRDYAPPLPSRISEYRDRVTPLVLRAIGERGPKRFLYDLVTRHLSREGVGLRPALCLATCGALGGRKDDALPSAAAIELLHNALLVHDEVEDDEGPPRGRATLGRHYGVPLAVNAGDAMNALGNRVLRQNFSKLGADLSTRVFDEFDRMHIAATEGQAMERGWIRDKTYEFSEEDHLLMVLKKTGWYSFIHPVRIGALIARPDRTDLDTFNAFGYFLGTALQMRSDALRIGDDGRRSRNEIDPDFLEGRFPFVLTHLLRVSDERERAKLAALLAKAPSQRLPHDLSWILDRLRFYGSVEYVRHSAEDFARKALEEFDTAYATASEGPDLDFLRSLVEHAIRPEGDAHTSL